MDGALRVAAGLVRLEVLAACDPPWFLHLKIGDMRGTHSFSTRADAHLR
jgi:hypothetical protein